MRLSILSLLLIFSLASFAQKFYLFTGTYTGTGSKGIYVYQFNAANGTASLVSNTDSVANPSYLTVSADAKNLYAVNETHPGYVSSFSFNKKNAKLSFINSQPTGGFDPCYVIRDNTGKWLMVANYTGGSIAVFPVNQDGSLKPYSQLIQDSGSSVNKERQEKAHVHSAIFSPDQNFLFSPDLGMDKVMIYKFKPSLKKPLIPASPAYEMTMAGEGPRHFVFHPNKKFAYLISELSGAVSAYNYHDGKLKKFQNIKAHPEDFKGVIGSADIHISPDGMYLYVSNRGDENTITIFSINNTGKLKLSGYQSTMGKTPRNFIIDPTGNYLLVANQGSDNIVIFKRDKKTGLLKETGNEIKVPKPVCLQMAELK
ncbi:MAG: lactonase family protein [Bacteroidota bacterium]|nr:lactonase family protein [Bacteroidota bacterium]